MEKKYFCLDPLNHIREGKSPAVEEYLQNNTVKYCCVLHQAKDASTVFKVKSLDGDRATSMVMEALARHRTTNQSKCHCMRKTVRGLTKKNMAQVRTNATLVLHYH